MYGAKTLSCARLLNERLIFRSTGYSTQKVLDRYFRKHGADPVPYLTLDSRNGVYETVANKMGIGFVWMTGTRRNEDICQIPLEGGDTESQEVVFAPQNRSMQTLQAVSLIDERALGGVGRNAGRSGR